MVSFFHQLGVLLWKNWLSARRQPVWSCVLIIWPIVIFIILAITRSKFPPELVQNCHLASRNLPSTGLVPFLETYLCATDSRCKNVSYEANSTSNSCDASNNGSSTRMLDLPWNTLHQNTADTQTDDGGGGEPSPGPPEQEVDQKALPGSSSSRVKRDTGSGTDSGATLDLGQISSQNTLPEILKILLCNLTRIFVPAATNNTGIQFVTYVLSNYCSTDQSLLSASVQEVSVLLLPLLADPENQILLLTGVYKGVAVVKTVQGSTSLWNSLLDLPGQIFNLNSDLPQSRATNRRQPRSSGAFQDVRYITSCLQYFKKLGQVDNSSDQTQTASSTSITEDLEDCISFFQKFACDPSTEECWPDMQHYYEWVYWLITSLTNTNGSSVCSLEISSMDVVCEDSTLWQQFYQSAVTAVQTAMQNHTVVQRILNQGWTFFQQNGLGEIFRLALNSQPTDQSSLNQELPPIVKNLLMRLLNVTQEMISKSFQSSSLNNSSRFMELVQKLLETIQQNTKQVDGNNWAELIKNLSMTVQNTQFWKIFSLGSTQPLSETSQALHNLQTLIEGWMSLSSQAGNGSSNYTEVLIQVFSSLEQPEFIQLLQSVQNFFMANETSKQSLEVLLDSMKLFTQILSMKGADDVSVLGEAYQKQLLNFLLSGSSLQGALPLLNPYFKISSQLPLLNSKDFSTMTLDILSFLTPTNLQTAGISEGNISSALLSLFSDFIPREYQDIFQEVVNATLQVLESVEVCKNGPSNCIQSQLLDKMGTLTNLLPMFLSPNITEFLQLANKVLNVTSCYNETQLDPLLCTLDLTPSLVELLQTFQLPQPVLDRISIVSSIVQYWRSAIGGNVTVDQQLSYLHDLTTIIFQNEPTVLTICSSISDIVLALNATNLGNTSSGFSQTMNVLLGMMQFSESAALRYNISSDFFSTANNTLENAKTQLQIAAWHLTHLTNQTELQNLSNVIYHIYKITLLLVDNSIANSWNYTEFLPNTLGGLGRLADLILGFIFQDHVQPLQLFINTLQGGLEKLFRSDKDLLLPWLALNTEEMQRVLKLALLLQQEYGVNQSETNVVLTSIDNTIHVLKYLRQHLAALGPDSSALYPGFDNETARVVYALFAEGTSILHETEKTAASKEIFQRLYHFSHLLEKDWNGTVLQNASSLETQLLNILFAAISPFLGENTTGEASPRTCSVKNALHIITQVIFQNKTLNESMAETDCQMPFTVMTFENGTLLNQTLGDTLRLIMQVIGLTDEFGPNFESGQTNVVGEFMACIVKSLRLSIGVLLEMSNLSGIKGPWIQAMYETLTSISEAVPESHISCITPNSQILNLVDNICLNHSNPFHVMISFIYNQANILLHGSLRNQTSWSKMSNMITKILYPMNGHPDWNNIMYELFLQWSNSSELPEFRTVWNTVNIMLRTDWNLTEINSLVNNLGALKSAVELAGNKVGPEVEQVYNSFVSILYEMQSLGFQDLTNIQNLTMGSSVISQCKMFSELINGIIFNQTQAASHNGLLSNVSLLACNYLSTSNSFSMLEGGLQILGSILSSSSLAPGNIFKYLNDTEQLFSVLQEAMLNGQSFTDGYATQTLSELFDLLIEITDEIKTTGQTGENPALKDLFSLLSHIIQNDTESNASGIIVVEKATFQAASILRELLKNINAPSVIGDISSASDILQMFFNSIHNSPDENSVDGRILEQAWAIFQRSGIEKLLNEQIQLMLSTQFPNNQQLPAVATSLLQLLFNITNELLSDMTLAPPFININSSMKILTGLVERLQQIAYQDTRFENWRKIFQVFIQDVESWNKLSIGNLFMQNETDHTVKELESLVATWTSISTGSFSTSTTIMKLFYVLNQPEFMQIVETFQNIFTPSHNFTEVTTYLLDALQMFNHIISMNSTAEVQVPTEVYLQQILNFLTSDTNIHRAIFWLGPYSNISGQLPFVHSEELREFAMEMLSFISPPNLLNLSSSATNTLSDLLSLMSKYIPRDEKAAFDSAANITLLAIESMQTCHTEQSNCTRVLHEFQQLAGEFVQLLAMMENSSLGEEFNISSLPNFAVYNDIQVSLISSIFSLLWSSRGNSINSETDITAVFQKVISLRDLLLNESLRGDLNWTLIQSLSGPLNLNASEVRSALEMCASSNVSELLLQIQSVVDISDCYHRSESSSLLCMLDLTLHVVELLERQPLPQPLQNRLSIAVSIIKFWMGALKDNATLYQQLNYLYNLTMAVFQNDPVLSVTHSAVSDIVKSLNNIRINVNVSSPEYEATIITLLDLIQPKEFELLDDNMSATLYLPTKDQLQRMQVEFEIAKWYVLYLENQTEGIEVSNVGYPWYTIAQLILSNTLPNIHKHSALQSFLNNMQNMAAVLNQSQSIPAVQFLGEMPFQDFFQELQQVINYTEAVIHILFPNHTNPSFSWVTLVKENALSVMESTLHLLQNHNGNKFTNMSLGFDFADKYLEMLNGIRRILLAIDAHNLGRLPGFHQDTSQKLDEVFEGGVSLINSIEMGGASSKNIIYAMYNFSHLLLGEDLNGNFSYQDFMLDSKLLDSVISILTFALTERNENGSMPQLCSMTEVFHLIMGVAFGNTTLHDSLSQSRCQLSFVFQYLENGTITNQTLEEILQGALHILELAEQIAEVHNNTSYNVGGQTACIINSLQLTTHFFSKLDNIVGYNIPWIQPLHEALSTFSEQLTDSNITCPATLGTLNINILDSLSQNQSNPLTIPLILSLIDFYAQVTLPNISLSDLMFIFSVLPNSESWAKPVLELMQVFLNPPGIPESDLFVRVQHILEHMAAGNWTMTEVSELRDLLERLSDAFNLTGSGLGQEVVQAQLFLGDILKGIISPSLLNLDSWTPQLDSTAVSLCKDLVKTLATASQNSLKDLEMTPPSWGDFSLASNITFMACDLLLSSNNNFNWAEELKKAEGILSYASQYSPTDTAKYFQAAGKFLPMLSNLLMNGSSFTSDNGMGSIFEMLTLFLELFDLTDVADVLANPSLQELLSLVLNMATAGGNGSHILATEGAVRAAVDFVEDTLRAFNLSSAADTLSHLSENLQLLINRTQPTTSQDSTDNVLDNTLSLLDNIPFNLTSFPYDDTLESLFDLLLPFLELQSENATLNHWIDNPDFQNLVFFLTSSMIEASINESQVNAGQNATLHAISNLQMLLKTLNFTSFSEVFTFASEVVTLLFNRTDKEQASNNVAQRLLDLKEALLNQSAVNPYQSLLNCLEDSMTWLANQSQENREVIFQLIQSLLAHNYTFEDISVVPEVLGLKVSQLQNLTNLMCDSSKIGPATETCQLPCQYLLQTLNMMKLGFHSLTATRAANDIKSRAATDTTTNVAYSSNSVLNTLLQNIAAQLKSINWIPSDFLPLGSLQNMSQYFALAGLPNLIVPVPQVGNIFGNVNDTKLDLIKTAGLSSENVDAMMEVTITNTTFQMIAWFQQLYACSKDPSLVPPPLRVFCNMSALQGYQMAIVLLRNVDLFNFVYRMYLPLELQNSIDTAIIGLTQLAGALKEKMAALPSIEETTSQLNQLQNILDMANAQMSQMQRRKRETPPTPVPFSVATLVNVLCVKNIPLLFAYISQIPPVLTSRAETPLDQDSVDLVEQYGIPANTTNFCKKILVNMINTTNGAFYWVFLKPMLYGQIIYTPETAETRTIMQKVNATLAELNALRMGASSILSLTDNIAAFSSLITSISPLLDQVQSYLRNPLVQALFSTLGKANATELNSEIDKLKSYIGILEDNQPLLEQITPIVTLFVNLAECISYDRIRPASSSQALDDAATLLRQQNKLFAGVIFDNLPSTKRRRRATSNSTALPRQVKYTIRMNIALSQPTNAIRDLVWVPGPHESASKYMTYSKAFVFLQDSIERAIIELQTQLSLSDIAVQFQPMPYSCYTKDNFLYSVGFSLPIVLMVAWVLFVAAFVKRLVLEKDLRLHEYMKMMGVNTCSHFFAWFIESAIFLTITVIILVIIIKFGGILPRSDGGLIFLFLMDYSLSIIAMSYLVSVFFHNTNIAALSGSLIYIISFFPFIVMTSQSSTLSFAGKTLLGLFSPTALSYAAQYATLYEEQSLGLQWDNMYYSPVTNDTCSFAWMCWLLLIDSGIYFIVGSYIQTVFPGRYGIGSPWYFPFLPSFWKECCGLSSVCTRKKSSGLMVTNLMAESAMSREKKGAESAPSDLSPVFEPEPHGLVAGVSLHGLTKIFNSKEAVSNLNMNFYEGHITALLGHNGAGKTTTISMLTGLFSATSGTINVYGEDIHTHLDHIRKSMGVCMQYDVLFSHLTCKEHLLLYGAIKAPQWDKRRLHDEVKRTLKDTGLYSHRRKAVRSLSGGMKRKLSICIALIGGSRVIILDEPTSGVDPCSRRAIWEIISKNKHEKTIILSTHHLDEAEVLSDRIAFLENGGLKCCGSPFFLKEKFGEGYHLTLTKKYKDRDTDQHCNTEAVTALIQSHIPEAYLKEDIGEELVYILPPFNAGISAAYLSLLRALDTGLDGLHIGCYGISDTTVEEVFLKLTEGLDFDENAWSRTKMVVPIGGTDDLMLHDESSTSSYSFRDDQALTRTKKIGGYMLLLKKMFAIFIKRFHNSRRNWKGLISQILLPVLFVIAAMGLGTLTSDAGEYPPLLLSPALYGSTGQNVAFGNSNSSTDDLVNAMLSFPGIDNSCMNISNCLSESQLGAWTSAGNESGSYCTCKCTKTTRDCGIPKNANPPRRQTFSKQVIYNLSGYNMENYLLTTTNNFQQTRYGAWSFGLPLTSDLLLDSSPIPPNRTLSKVWYNSEGYHSLPAYLNSFNNFLLRANLPSNLSSQYGIFVSSHPYPGALNLQQTQLSNLVNILVALCILVGYSITTASFVIYTVKEHQNGSKRLQHISGVSETCYWVTNFLYDMFLYMLPVALSIATIAGFKLSAFYENQNLGAVSLLFVMFGFATFTWMYLLAGTFKNVGMAFIVFVCINLFIGINTIISATVVNVLALDTSQNDTVIQNLGNVSAVLEGIFKIFPQFCFGYGLIKLSQEQQIVDYYKAFGYTHPSNVFSMDKLGWMFVALMFQGGFFFVLRLLINNTIYQNIRMFLKERFDIGMRPVINTVEEDEDVKAERDRVESGRGDTDLLQIHGLSKFYHQVNKKVLAVNNMSFGIRAGECFGLLGVNGAGKTTTFKMLTGDIAPSSGRIQIQDRLGCLVNVLDCHSDWSTFGYCPQEDALDDLLTGEEHLYYYARIHGIPEKRIRVVVNDLLNKLQLMQYKSRITEAYSCGTKRKLSTALALIGGPSILLLDEPSSGMDPKTKRHLWKVISEEVRDKCAVVLTSHSMEECEALCTRLAIMVRGAFQCIGSMQHIKNRFGSGFTVKMHLRDTLVDVEALTQLMRGRFPNTYLKDHHLTMVEYHVPVSAGGVANIFDLLEANKAAFNIQHFSVSQTTLDEVFINFAQAQVTPDNSNSGSEDLPRVIVS
ncbi:glucosylceramide transporter ABCA12 [Lissotriton helveticus]